MTFAAEQRTDRERVWEFAEQARDGINQGTFGGHAPNDSSALSEVGDGSVLNLRDAACFTVDGGRAREHTAIEVVVVAVPTEQPWFAAADDVKAALGQSPTRGESIGITLVQSLVREFGEPFVAKVAADMASTLAKDRA